MLIQMAEVVLMLKARIANCNWSHVVGSWELTVEVVQVKSLDYSLEWTTGFDVEAYDEAFEVQF